MDGKFRLEDVTNFTWVKDEVRKRDPEFRDYPNEYFERCVAVYEDKVLHGFFITCTHVGIRSFHGYKFTKDRISEQMELAKKYIAMEKLEFSSYTNKKAGAALRLLGFKDLCVLDGVHIARKI